MEELYFGYPRRRKASPKRRKASPKRRKASPKRKVTKKMLDSLSLEKLKKLAKKYKVSCYKKGTKVCVKKSTLLKRLKSSRSINKILLSASKMRKEKKHRRSPKRSPKRRRSRFGSEKRKIEPTNFFIKNDDPDLQMNEVEELLSSGKVNVGDKLHYQGSNQGEAKECIVIKDKNGKLRCPWRYIMDSDYSDTDDEDNNFGRRSSRFGMKTIPPNYPNLSTPMTLSSGMTYKAMLDKYLKTSGTFLSSNMQSNGGYSAPGKSVHPPSDFRYNPRLLGTSSMPPYENISKPKSKFGQYFR